MGDFVKGRGTPALVVAVIALVAAVGGTALAGPVGQLAAKHPTVAAFSFKCHAIGPDHTLLSVDGLRITARCDGSTKPVITATTSSSHADLLGRVVNRAGKVKSIADDAFTTTSRDDLTAGIGSAADSDGSGTVSYERADGKVVTVNYSFDNSPTLGGEDVCTVFGTAISN